MFLERQAAAHFSSNAFPGLLESPPLDACPNLYLYRTCIAIVALDASAFLS